MCQSTSFDVKRRCKNLFFACNLRYARKGGMQFPVPSEAEGGAFGSVA